MVDAVIVLYSSTQRIFGTVSGYGHITEAISCEVEEERNGTFELKMKYPANGVLRSRLVNRNIIYCKPSPSRNAQAFRIYNVSKETKGYITVNASHISYDLSGYARWQETETTYTNYSSSTQALSACSKAFGAIVEAYDPDTPTTKTGGVVWPSGRTFTNFTFEYHRTDAPLDMTYTYGVGFSNLREVLGGSNNSIISVFGGELLFDNWTVHYYDKRTMAKNDPSEEDYRQYQLRYRKNIQDITSEDSSDLCYSALLPYLEKSTSSGSTWEMLTDIYYPLDGYTLSTIDYSRILPININELPFLPSGVTFKTWSQAGGDAGVKAMMKRYVQENNIGIVNTTIDVTYADLMGFGSRYEAVPNADRIDLGDMVNIYYPGVVDTVVQKEVIKITYDVLKNKITELTLGDRNTTSETTLDGMITKISSNYNDVQNVLSQPDKVSGTNDGTNWTKIKIGNDEYNIPSGGSSGVTSLGGVTGDILIPTGGYLKMTNNTLHIDGLEAFPTHMTTDGEYVLLDTITEEASSMSWVSKSSIMSGYLPLTAGTSNPITGEIYSTYSGTAGSLFSGFRWNAYGTSGINQLDIGAYSNHYWIGVSQDNDRLNLCRWIYYSTEYKSIEIGGFGTYYGNLTLSGNRVSINSGNTYMHQGYIDLTAQYVILGTHPNYNTRCIVMPYSEQTVYIGYDKTELSTPFSTDRYVQKIYTNGIKMTLGGSHQDLATYLANHYFDYTDMDSSSIYYDSTQATSVQNAIAAKADITLLDDYLPLSAGSNNALTGTLYFNTTSPTTSSYIYTDILAFGEFRGSAGGKAFVLRDSVYKKSASYNVHQLCLMATFGSSSRREYPIGYAYVDPSDNMFIQIGNGVKTESVTINGDLVEIYTGKVLFNGGGNSILYPDTTSVTGYIGCESTIDSSIGDRYWTNIYTEGIKMTLNGSHQDLATYLGNTIAITNSTVNTAGVGNAITALSISNGQITATKGATFFDISTMDAGDITFDIDDPTVTIEDALDDKVGLSNSENISGQKKFLCEILTNYGMSGATYGSNPRTVYNGSAYFSNVNASTTSQYIFCLGQYTTSSLDALQLKLCTSGTVSGETYGTFVTNLVNVEIHDAGSSSVGAYVDFIEKPRYDGFDLATEEYVLDNAIVPSKTTIQCIARTASGQGTALAVRANNTYTDIQFKGANNVTLGYIGIGANGKVRTKVGTNGTYYELATERWCWNNFQPLSCLIEGTLITMYDGTTKPIEEIKIGDSLMSWNPVTKTATESIVIGAKMTGEEQEYTSMMFDDGTHLETYGKHSFWRHGNGIVDVKDWNIGDKANALSGEFPELVWKKTVHFPIKKKHYVIYVSNNLYYANGILTGHWSSTKVNYLNTLDDPTFPAEVLEKYTEEANANNKDQQRYVTPDFIDKTKGVLKEISSMRKTITNYQGKLDESDYKPIKAAEKFIQTLKAKKLITLSVIKEALDAITEYDDSDRETWRSTINDLKPTLATKESELAALRNEYNGGTVDVGALFRASVNNAEETKELVRAWAKTKE